MRRGASTRFSKRAAASEWGLILRQPYRTARPCVKRALKFPTPPLVESYSEASMTHRGVMRLPNIDKQPCLGRHLAVCIKIAMVYGRIFSAVREVLGHPISGRRRLRYDNPMRFVVRECKCDVGCVRHVCTPLWRENPKAMRIPPSASISDAPGGE